MTAHCHALASLSCALFVHTYRIAVAGYKLSSPISSGHPRCSLCLLARKGARARKHGKTRPYILGLAPFQDQAEAE